MIRKLFCFLMGHYLGEMYYYIKKKDIPSHNEDNLDLCRFCIRCHRHIKVEKTDNIYVKKID